MKLAHLSDLHLGKRLRETSMLDDQKGILTQILDILAQERPHAVLIAGDIYDKPIPPAEAVEQFDHFLVELSRLGLPAFLISGNHDSAERLSFGSRLFDVSGIHISPVYDGTVPRYEVKDEHGVVDIFLLPFVKPMTVRHYLKDDRIESYTDAVRAALAKAERTEGRRSVVVAHQFVGNAERCASEEVSVGGSDMVDEGAFDGFDYVALGHLHGPQNVGASGRIRYCGTPLKYSFSEVRHNKSITFADMDAEGKVEIRTVPLTAKRDLVELRGSFQELEEQAMLHGNPHAEDHVRVILTDEEDVPDAMNRLRAIFHNINRLDYDNSRTKAEQDIFADEEAEEKSPLELFSEFFEMRNNRALTPEQYAFVQALLEEMGG